MKILIVKEKWAKMILSGEKTWEIRSTNTKVRGRIGIAISGTGKVYGSVEIQYSKQVDQQTLLKNIDKHKVLAVESIKYHKPHVWVMDGAIEYDEPIKYTHPQGAVIWVNDKNWLHYLKPRCYKENNETYPLCVGDDAFRDDVCISCNLYQDMEELHD